MESGRGETTRSIFSSSSSASSGSKRARPSPLINFNRKSNHIKSNDEIRVKWKHGQAGAAASQKKVRRSSGELLQATDEEGKVLPELLAEQGGPRWPRASATTQVLTFGASWENRSGVNFLNPAVGASDTASDDSRNSSSKKKRRKKRRHSEPVPWKRDDREGATDASGYSKKRKAGGSMGSGGANGGRRSGSGQGALLNRAEPLTSLSQGHNQVHRKPRERGSAGNTTDRSCGGRGSVKAGGGAADIKQELIFSPSVDVKSMALSGSPAPSVESEFWGGDDGDEQSAEVDQIHPKAAVQAALDRLMNTKGSRTKPKGVKGDAQLLESLLFSSSSSSHFEENCLGTAAQRNSTKTRKKGSSRKSRAPTSSSTPNTPAAVTNNNTGSEERPSSSALSATPSEPSHGPKQTNADDTDHNSPASSLASLSTPRSGDKYSISPGSGASTALNPSLWKLVERGDICPFEDCAFTVAGLEGAHKGVVGGGSEGKRGGLVRDESAGANGKSNKSRCRHFHTLCGCRHTRGALKGLLFQTNQLDKARNHQRKHIAGADSGQTVTSSQEPPSQLSQDTDISNTEHGHHDKSGYDMSLSQQSQDDVNAELDLLLTDGEALETDARGSVGGSAGKVTPGSGAGSGARDGRRTWTDAESDRLREVMEHRGGESRNNWAWVAARVGEAGGGRKTPSQCKMRWERILNPGVKKGLWTKEEDQKLKEVAAAMDYKWSTVAKMMGGRTYKQCRERYTNYLRDGLNCGPWSKEEDALLLEMHEKIGNKWAEIARHLKDRSENMIKNEYMKLSRDANHRRRNANLAGNDSGDESGAEGDDRKARKKKGKRKARLSNLSMTSSQASDFESPLPSPLSFDDGFAHPRGVLAEGTGNISPSSALHDGGVTMQGLPTSGGNRLGLHAAGTFLMPKSEERSI